MQIKTCPTRRSQKCARFGTSRRRQQKGFFPTPTLERRRRDDSWASERRLFGVGKASFRRRQQRGFFPTPALERRWRGVFPSSERRLFGVGRTSFRRRWLVAKGPPQLYSETVDHASIHWWKLLISEYLCLCIFEVKPPVLRPPEGAPVPFR